MPGGGGGLFFRLPLKTLPKKGVPAQRQTEMPFRVNLEQARRLLAEGARATQFIYHVRGRGVSWNGGLGFDILIGI